MEHLQKPNIKILLIVEGKKTEPQFFKYLTEAFGINAEIFSVGTNLYSLYQRMKEYQFECDVKDVLRELVPSVAEKEVLAQKFTYTYLIFDSDSQNKSPSQRGNTVNIANLTYDNFDKLVEMTKYFTDETDPSIGRLYINYPMMESYRYCDKFFDKSFLTAQIDINKMSEFKSLAGQKKLAGLQLQRYSKDNFSDLIRMHALKLSALLGNSYVFPLSYDNYLKESLQESIAGKQYKMAQKSKVISILNTSLFLILDYYGNRDSFYDTLMNTQL